MLGLIPKKYFIILALILVGFAIFVDVNQRLKERDRAISNLKAEIADKDREASSSKYLYQKTLSELELSQDSIILLLDRTRDSLRIKRKNVRGLQFISSDIKKTDTIVFRDTLFREYISADTIISEDEWYSARIQLDYPNTIVLSPQFKSEKHIIIHSQKETINPPKKFWLFRLFQKKHRVVKIEVIEKNPYIEHDRTKFIEVIK